MKPQNRLVHLLRLTLRDMWHERWLCFCTSCVLAATLAPLWTLWGLERGVIGTLIERQNRDPAMRLVRPETTGSQRFNSAWFTQVASWPEVAFVMPETRAIASQVDLFSEGAAAPLRVDLLPTAKADPLLGNSPLPSRSSLLLSPNAARRLAVTVGQTITVALERERAGSVERAALPLEVAGILSADQQDGMAALTAIELLQDIQAWRDGYTVGILGLVGEGPAPAMDNWPRFRAYAKSIQGVAPLAEKMEKEGITVYARSREIASTLGLQRNLRAVLGMVALIAGLGAVVAMIAMQIAAVQRKRRDFALLQLSGHGRGWLVAISGTAASVTALVGVLLALGVYLLASRIINNYFAGHLATGEAAVALGWIEIAWGAGGIWLMTFLPAVFMGWRSSNVEAADVLRDN